MPARSCSAATAVTASAGALMLCVWFYNRRKRRRTQDDVEEPEELQCSICATIFRDPVVTSRGYTYERRALLEYWRSAGCANGLRDPQSGNLLVEERLVPNWQIRHLVEKFLQDHPGYVPQGWPEAKQPPPARDSEGRNDEEVLPGAYHIADVVVCIADRQLADGVVLQKGEAGKVLGRSGPTTLRCSFLSLQGAVTVDPADITKQNLPGGYKVGDMVMSLINHSSEGRSVWRGHLGKVISQASTDVDVRLKVDFPELRGLDIHYEQICPETLPGGYQLDDAIVSLIDYSTRELNDGAPVEGEPALSVARNEHGTVVGQATAERRIRLKVDFQDVKGLDILPFQIAPLRLPGGFRAGDLVVSLIDYESAGMRLSRGDVGTVVGRAHRDPVRRVRVDFPNMRDLDIMPMQVHAHKESESRDT